MPSELYFQYDKAANQIGVWIDRNQRHGGMLPEGEGFGGNPIEAYARAVSGKAVARSGMNHEIKPARNFPVVEPA